MVIYNKTHCAQIITDPFHLLTRFQDAINQVLAF